jgi:NAD(P)-dependent dehydrogenase (short-subunit alcohol dehydrogenase family)
MRLKIYQFNNPKTKQIEELYEYPEIYVPHTTLKRLNSFGFGCAEALVASGARVVLSSRRADRLQEAAGKLGGEPTAGFVPGDATRRDDVQRITDEAKRQLGGLDTLVISAGTSMAGSIFEADPDVFQAMCDANLLPIFLATRYAAGDLVASGNGSVVVIASIYGIVGQYDRVAYCTAKAGAIGMTRAMALDFSEKNVRVNAICPGFVETELALGMVAQADDPAAMLKLRRAMHPMGRSGQPREIGEAAAYLASDATRWMTGQTLTLDGGYVAR